MKLENIMLNEISQIQKDKYSKIPCICYIKNRPIYKEKVRDTQQKRKLERLEA